MRDLRSKSTTFIPVDRFFPSTQLCSSCGRKKKMSLDERIYHCECGLSIERDANSFLNILIEGLTKDYIPTVRRNSKPLEMETSSTKVKEIVEKHLPEIMVKLLSVKKEAPAI